MNETMENFAREQIRDGLALCNDPQINLFVRMYSHNDLAKPVSQIVDDIPTDSLSIALSQVERTIAKNAANEKGQK